MTKIINGPCRTTYPVMGANCTISFQNVAPLIDLFFEEFGYDNNMLGINIY